MPRWIKTPQDSQLIQAELLTQASFSDFGTVIENPSPSLVPSPHLTTIQPNAVQANQGSALKYLDVTHIRDLYSTAPSGQPSKAVMNMFVCSQRELDSKGTTSNAELSSMGSFPVRILERHPYTTQTFIPLGLSPREAHEARYLVIVAPTLPSSPLDIDLPVPQPLVGDGTVPASGGRLPGRGLPDISRIRAFVANGSQAVTYGAGTWHAPMVVVGERPVAFVVVQFANGIGLEDCQEVEWENEGEGRVEVVIPKDDSLTQEVRKKRSTISKL